MVGSLFTKPEEPHDFEIRCRRRSRPWLCRPAYADNTSQFVIIKDANKHCRVVEKSLVSEDELGMQIGKQAYPSMDEANIDLKVVCDNS